MNILICAVMALFLFFAVMAVFAAYRVGWEDGKADRPMMAKRHTAKPRPLTDEEKAEIEKQERIMSFRG